LCGKNTWAKSVLLDKEMGTGERSHETLYRLFDFHDRKPMGPSKYIRYPRIEDMRTILPVFKDSHIAGQVKDILLPEQTRDMQ
jgi:hypothetical protein